MADKQILLLWGDPRERQELYKILCATGAQVQYADIQNTWQDEHQQCRLVVIDYDTARESADRLLSELAQLENKPAVLVVTATRDKQDLVQLMDHKVLTNLIAKNVDVTANELIVTVNKVMRNDVFGMEKYMTWGIAAREQLVSSSEQKGPCLDELEEYLHMIGANRRLVSLARGVGDEFLMNAVYNAPVDAAGETKYASQSRSEPVQLEDSEKVRFRYACDGRLLALSVEDQFGRLTRETVLHYLRKCFSKGEDQIDQKDGGAGLGLYYIFESLNQFIINVSPNKRTEMIGIMDISGSYRKFAERPKSLNIFLEEVR